MSRSADRYTGTIRLMRGSFSTISSASANWAATTCFRFSSIRVRSRNDIALQLGVGQSDQDSPRASNMRSLAFTIALDSQCPVLFPSRALIISRGNAAPARERTRVSALVPDRCIPITRSATDSFLGEIVYASPSDDVPVADFCLGGIGYSLLPYRS